MKTRYLFIFPLLLCINQLQAQDKSLNLYSNFLYFSMNPAPSSFQDEERVFSFRNAAIGYNWENKKERGQELTLGFVYATKETAISNFKKTLIQARYLTKRNLLTTNNGKVNMWYAYAIRLYYQYEKSIPQVSQNFPKTKNDFGINPSMFAGVNIDLTDKLLFTASTTLGGFTNELSFSRTENPILTPGQQRIAGFDFTLLGERILRIGLGYRF